MSLLSQQLLLTHPTTSAHTAVRTIALFNSNQADGSTPIAEIGTISSTYNATLANNILHLNQGCIILEPIACPELLETKNFTFEVICQGNTLPYLQYIPSGQATHLVYYEYEKSLFTCLNGSAWAAQTPITLTADTPLQHLAISHKNQEWAIWVNGIRINLYTIPEEGYNQTATTPIRLGLYSWWIYNNYSTADILSCRVTLGNPYSHDANILVPNWPLVPLSMD